MNLNELDYHRLSIAAKAYNVSYAAFLRESLNFRLQGEKSGLYKDEIQKPDLNILYQLTQINKFLNSIACTCNLNKCIDKTVLMTLRQIEDIIKEIL